MNKEPTEIYKMNTMVWWRILPQLLRTWINRVTSGLVSLRGSPQELWYAYLLKFLDSFAYFSFSLVLTLFLSHDFGYSDIAAGTLYGAWGALITVYGLIAGALIDKWGVATSLRVGFALTLVARIIIFTTTSRFVLVSMICGLLPMGSCLGIPVLTVGIKRYTHPGNRGLAFGLFYVVMNVAALFSGPIMDICTRFHMDQDGTNEDSNNLTWELSGYRLVVLSGIVANVLAVGVTWWMREIKIEAPLDSSVIEDGLMVEASSNRGHTHHDKSSCNHDQTTESFNNRNNNSEVAPFTPLKANAWAIFLETTNSPRFWRFLVVCLITLNVRMIFRHLDATFPKYMLREFGENVPKGTIYSINPALIILLVPLVTAATSEYDPLLMIHHGSYISSVSVFFMVLSTTIWSSVAFVIVLSIGEAIWSPRLYDYTMSVSKEGREGTYGALSSAPLFLAKLPVGFLSGFLLQHYCPEQGPRNSKTMWLIIGLTTALSPLLMTVSWKYISYKDEEEDQDTSYTELQQQQQQQHFSDSLSSSSYQNKNNLAME